MTQKKPQNSSVDTQNINQLEQSFSASIKVIDQLFQVLKGNSSDLDGKIANLKKSIKSDDVKQTQKHLKDTATVTKKFETEFHLSLRQLKEQFLDIGERFQSFSGMDSAVRRSLRMLLNRIKSTDSNRFIELQPQLISLLKLFVAIAQTRENAQAIPNAQDANQTDLDASAVDDNMMEKLVTGLSALSGSEVIKPSLDTFSERVKLTRSNQQKLEVCLSFFEDVVGRFSDEFTQTQTLIVRINTALGDVHATLLESLKSSKGFDEQLRSLNKKIDKQISELSDTTNKAQSLSELQVVIDKKLTVINTSIKRRDDIEKQRSDKLHEALQKMETKLGGLEQRTDYYRQKWLEEKVKNGIDTLTGLPNRSAYDSRIQEEYQRWLRIPQPMSIAVIDIDHFKKINDNYGHSVGDKTLKIVANTLRENLRTTDFLARYGGEEFVVIMLNAEKNTLESPLEKLRKAVEKIPFKVKDTPLNITISIGYTPFLANDNVHTAFDRADKALYEAKETGRNKVCYKK